ncbi:MAG: thiamine pyrophosphate-binding protein [Acidimicrobiales bacterium]
MPTVAQLMVSALRALEIENFFCLPGVQNDDFFDALVDAPDIRPIVTRHEQGAGYMAFGASQLTDKPSAFAVVPGPGILNAGAALTSAYWAGGRTLAIVGAIPAGAKGKGIGLLHELPNQSAVLEQVTKHNEYIESGETAVEQVNRALVALLSGEPRPVSVEVPVDVWSHEVDTLIDRLPELEPAPTPDADALVAAVAAVGAAERPLIVVGGGAHGASAEVQQLAELLNAPVTTRRQGHGVIDAQHPLWAPMPVGREFWRDADVVVGIGTRMEFPIMHWGVDDAMSIVQINLDADELDRHGLGAIGLHGDAATTVRSLIEALDGRVSSIADRRDEVAVRRRRFESDSAVLAPQRAFLAAIADAMPTDAIIVEDVTQLGFAAHIAYDFHSPKSFLTSGPAGTLGAGVAHAIGVQSAAGDRRVLNLVGDGGFLFSATELATAKQFDIPVTILLHDNRSYGNVKGIQTSRFGEDRLIASTLENPDFVAMGEAFGVRSRGVETADELRDALAQAVAHDGPSMVVLSTGDLPSPWPWLRMQRVRG